MKKYLIAFAAMAVAVSSCAEKMSSGDNVPDGGDKVPEKTKLVKRITQKHWDPSNPGDLWTYFYDFSYDDNNRIVKIVFNDIRGGSSATEVRVYSGNTATYITTYAEGTDSQTILFEGNKVVGSSWGDGSVYYLYDNNSEKVTSFMYNDGTVGSRYVWDARGNMVKWIYDEDDTIQITYTDKLNKANILIESDYLYPFYAFYYWIDKNACPSLCSNYLVAEIDWGRGPWDVSHFSYKFDNEGCPIEVSIPGYSYKEDNGASGVVWSYLYELEYY